ncbi:hypothetical protein ACVJGD_008039 [Bradyrhizobium sp. USDA 10063]
MGPDGAGGRIGHLAQGDRHEKGASALDWLTSLRLAPRLSRYEPDLFGGGLSNDATGAPAWRELPAEAQAALTSLMTRLILDHAATTATPRAKEVDHDL